MHVSKEQAAATDIGHTLKSRMRRRRAEVDMTDSRLMNGPV